MYLDFLYMPQTRLQFLITCFITFEVINWTLVCFGLHLFWDCLS